MSPKIISHSSPIINKLCIGIFILAGLLLTSCNKLVQIQPPQNTTTTSKVFNTEALANQATAGLYSSMINTSFLDFGSGSVTILAGMSADEIGTFDQVFEDLYVQFQNNNLTTTNGLVTNNIWLTPYSIIYQTNAVIEGLSNSSNLLDSVKNELTGEAKFIRAFCYFYLTNFFGDVPLVTTTNWNKTVSMARTSSSKVYKQIVSDLQDAQRLLLNDFSVAGGERTRANKFAATAMLARVYLYTGDWKNAEMQSTAVINNTGLFNLPASLTDVFSANSSEAILQLQQSYPSTPFNGTWEGLLLIPPSPTPDNPYFYLTTNLINTFDSGDIRKSVWTDSAVYNNVTFYYPYKYIVGPTQETPGGDISQYYMMLRLAEQYLIRAEARVEQNNLADGASDLNIIRNRAGLSNTTATGQSGLLAAIAHERQVELFAEWGHRWLDLKRTNQATTVLGQIKAGWKPTAEFYPIPLTEMTTDPNLTQNNGY